MNSKTNIAQAPHLPSHAKPTRIGTDDTRSKPHEHADGIAHRELLARAKRPHDAQVDALERRRIRYACTARGERQEYRGRGTLLE